MMYMKNFTAEEARDRMLLLTDSIINMLGGTEKIGKMVFIADAIIRKNKLVPIEPLCGFEIQAFEPDRVTLFNIIPAMKKGEFVIMVQNNEGTEKRIFKSSNQTMHDQFVAIHEYVRSMKAVTDNINSEQIRLQ